MARRQARPAAVGERRLVPERTQCVECGGPLWLEYCNQRTVTTLDGPIHFTLHIRRCQTRGCGVTWRGVSRMPGAPRPGCGHSPNNWRPNTLIAGASLLEGLEETLTVTRLGLTGSLLDTFKSTNPIESMISIARDGTGNVKRWKNGKMVVRWMAAGLLDAEKRFRRVNGYRNMPMLRVGLRRHRQRVESTRRSA